MKTLFLQAPSFDGFDGGAGSRYQAKREIQSFWYPTWLAQPAALVENSRLIDAPPHRTGIGEVVKVAQAHDLVVLHTSTPSFASDVKTIEAMKAAKPDLKVGLVGAKVAVQPQESLEGSPLIDFVARNEFDFAIKEIADGRDFAAVDGISYRNRDGADRPQPGAPDPARHGPTALRDAGLQARPRHQELLHRVPQAPLPLVLYRAGLQIALHLLPLAADRRRPPLPHPLGRPCDRRDPLGEGGVSGGEGVLLRRRHLHRRHAARRGDRPRTRQARRHLVLQRQGQCAARDAEGDARQRAAAAPRRLQVRQPADPPQHQEGHADRRRQALLARTAPNSASPSTAPSSSAFPARPGRRSRRPSASPRR